MYLNSVKIVLHVNRISKFDPHVIQWLNKIDIFQKQYSVKRPDIAYF